MAIILLYLPSAMNLHQSNDMPDYSVLLLLNGLAPYKIADSAQLVFRVTLVSVNSDGTTQSGVQNASK